MGNTLAFQIDAFQNDAFQTYDIELDVSGKPAKITRVHVLTKPKSFRCHVTSVVGVAIVREGRFSTHSRQLHFYATKRKKVTGLNH